MALGLADSQLRGAYSFVAWKSTDWLALTGIAAFAVIVRMAFFTGFFGSDEVTYTLAALEIAKGNWSASDYIGALRYGINIPVAFFITLFGPGEFSANLWGLICSVGEVALVFVLAFSLWGMKAALLSSLIIAALPSHVHLAGRLMADSPLAFFITLSFLLFLFAEKRQNASLYLAAGLAAGFVFWIKEVVILYLAVFGLYALIYRAWNKKWVWAALGGLTMMASNFLLNWTIQHDPLHMVSVIFAPPSADYLESIETSPWYYFRYMFLDMRHTWIMPYLALAGIVVWANRAIRGGPLDKDTGYVVLWAVGLVGVFSFTIMSVDPILPIPKQTNYMLIFAAPLALLGGFFLAQLKGWILPAVLAVLVLGSLVLAGLQQQAIRIFTANSKAAVEFARAHPQTPVYGMTNAYRAGTYFALMRGGEYARPLIRSLEEFASDRLPMNRPRIGSAYAIVDLETINWGGNALSAIEEIPGCWQKKEALEPQGFGLGKEVASMLLTATQPLPKIFADSAGRRLDRLIRPKPAYVYEIPGDCEFAL